LPVIRDVPIVPGLSAVAILSVVVPVLTPEKPD
jgi:hypothetical protein